MTLREVWNETWRRVGFPGHVVMVEGELGPSGRIVGMYLGPGQPEIGADERPGLGRLCIVGYIPAVDAPVPGNGSRRRIRVTIWGVGSTWEEAIASASKAVTRTVRVALALTLPSDITPFAALHRDREQCG